MANSLHYLRLWAGACYTDLIERVPAIGAGVLKTHRGRIPKSKLDQAQQERTTHSIA